MSTFIPDRIIVEGLKQFSTPTDIRKDLHKFATYFMDRTVKRSSRTNQLSRADVGRLAKILDKPEIVTEFERRGTSAWLNLVDYFTFYLKFISYQTDGRYPNDQNKTYLDNYVTFDQKAHDTYLNLSLLAQEQALLKVVVETTPYELFWTMPFGQLHPFWHYYNETTPPSDIRLVESRNLLLQLLGQCQSGVWYRTASIIRYLRETQPNFLIPPLSPKKVPRWTPRKSRYELYHEGPKYNRDSIPDNAPDAFERVEGRFVERFLEGIPLLLGYVDVAYRPDCSGVQPERDCLVAFRVHDHFLQLLQGQLAPPKVTIQPNFEIHIESGFYPHQTMCQLLPLAQLQKEDRVIIFKLNKKLVAEAVVRNPQLDVGQLLRQMSGRDLPQNVQIELDEWVGYADVFTLFNGFGLLESVGPPPAKANPYIVESITPHFHLVRHPQLLVETLCQAESVVLAISHRADSFELLPEKAQTIFPRSRPEPKRPTKEPLLISRETWITLYVATEIGYHELSQLLVENRTLFESHKSKRQIRYKAQFQSQVEDALKKLKEKYLIQVEEV